jgi:homoserine O-acetyltransferase
MDTHDIARGRGDYGSVLASIDKPALVVGIDSDVLYPLVEQRELVELMPAAELAILESPHGHDSFLIELDTLDAIVREWRARVVDRD